MEDSFVKSGEKGAEAKILESKKEVLALLSKGVAAEKEELEEVRKLSEMERAWWRDFPPYETNEEILDDFEKGILAKIGDDGNLKLIMRFSNPELEKWQPYLNKEAARLLREVGERWREKMKAAGLPDDIRLAVTSLVRTKEYQKEIISAGKLAMPDSPHTKGQSFDIDGCGYYIEDSVVNPRQCENYREIYKPLVHQILKEVLEEMKNEGRLSYIQEYKNTGNQCFHTTRNPSRLFPQNI
ncbi:MAG: hypothetical protein GXP44_00715 [bacterium]|nr:hypothetical protein [bacterium]